MLVEIREQGSVTRFWKFQEVPAQNTAFDLGTIKYHVLAAHVTEDGYHIIDVRRLIGSNPPEYARVF